MPNLNQSKQILKKWIKNVDKKLGIRKFLGWEVNDIQVYIISYPKSGRTWLQILLGKALCDNFKIDEELLLETHSLTRRIKAFPTLFTHDLSDVPKKWNEIDTDKSRYHGKKIVFLVRDPKDLIVSRYFQLTNRKKRFSGSISEFIRSDIYGIKHILSFYKIWFEKQTISSKFLLLKYEDMHYNTDICLRSLLNFINAKDVPESVINNAVYFSRFDNLKKLEQSGHFDDKKMQAINKNNKNSYKVRKGKIGGHKDYLSKEDIDFLDQVILEIGNPFYSQISNH